MVRSETQNGITTTTDTGDGGRLVLTIALGLGIAIAGVWYLISGLDSLRVAIMVVVFAALTIAAFLLGRNTQRVESVAVDRAEDEGYAQGRSDVVQNAMTSMQISMQMMRMMQAAQQTMGFSQLQTPAQQPVPQLTDAPRFVSAGNGVLISRDVILKDASALLKLHQAGVAVSRKTAQGEGITDPTRYQRAIEQLRAWGYVREMVQGQAPVWNDEAEGDGDEDRN